MKLWRKGMKNCLVGIGCLVVLFSFGCILADAETVVESHQSLKETDDLWVITKEADSIGEHKELSKDHVKSYQEANTQISVATVNIQGLTKYDYAYQFLELINVERQNRGLTPLAMDQQLQAVCMERAAEINVDFDTKLRPNGEAYSSILDKYNYKGDMNTGETLTGAILKNSTPESMLKSYMNSSVGLEHMFNPENKSVGIGSFTQGDKIFWTTVFSRKEVLNYKKVLSEQVTYIMDVTTDREVIIDSNIPWSVNVDKSEQLYLSIVNNFSSLTKAKISNESTNWRVSDPTIATIDSSGMFLGIKPGKTIITGEIKTNPNWNVERLMTVGENVDPPKFNVNNVLVKEIGESFDPLLDIPFEVFDYLGNDLKDRVVVLENDVNIEKPGTYQVIFSVTDDNGRTTKQKISVVVYDATPIVEYQTHVQNIGWQNAVENGQTAGTIGKGYRLEGLRIKLYNKPCPGDIVYSTHIQSIGWQTEVKNNEISGTIGKGKRLEAIKMKLTGELAEKYDVYYRVYTQNFGWLDWAKNGSPAGTQAFGYRLEGIQIRLVKKGQAAPGSDELPYKLNTKVNYSTHVQSIGWQNYVSNGQIAGTSGRSYRLEGLKIKLDNTPVSGGVEYSTHIQRVGWQQAVRENQLSGTSGKKLRLEAAKIKLTGQMAKEYDIYYRVHAQKFGWLGWAKNSEPAGTAGYGYRLEAIQIQLVKKGGKAPASTIVAYKEK